MGWAKRQNDTNLFDSIEKTCTECNQTFLTDAAWKNICKKCYAFQKSTEKERHSTVQIIHAIRPDEDTLWFRTNFADILSMCDKKKSPQLYKELERRFSNRPPWEE